MENEIFDGDNIAQVLTAGGLSCDFMECKIAPQLINYYFKLHNPFEIEKARRMARGVQAVLGCRVDFNGICKNGASFCLQIEREQRAFPSFFSTGGVLGNCEPFSVYFGKDIDGNDRTATLREMTHIVIGGTTGGGKSVLLHDLICSLIAYNEKSWFVMVDPKATEFSIYKNNSHLAVPIQTDPIQIKNTFDWLVREMEGRYSAMARAGLTENDGRFSHIVVVVDEFCDLIMQDEEIKPLLVRLLQKSRACGMTFILATQSVRAKVLDGMILANCPTRIALKCASYRESLLILDHKGAEGLLGKGDAIVKLPNGDEFRVQCPNVDREQLKNWLNK